MNTQHSQGRQAKEQLYNHFAAVAAALANPHRLELLDLLIQASHTVEELAEKAHMSVANTSQHLQRLKHAQLVIGEREGLYVRYRLADPAVGRLWLELRSVATQQNAEVERALDAYRERRHEFEQITVEELRSRLREGDAVLIDARPAAEYEAGHLPGAISVPSSEVEKLLAHLPDNKQIVAYCRGPQCVMADEALAILAEKGWRVARLEEGVMEWQLAGYEIERSTQ